MSDSEDYYRQAYEGLRWECDEAVKAVAFLNAKNEQLLSDLAMFLRAAGNIRPDLVEFIKDKYPIDSEGSNR